METVTYSVVIPVFDEEKSVLNELGKGYEIIFIDDGITDGSFQILRGLHQKDGNVKVLKFTRNFGHHIAISAGLDYSRGNAVVLLDADLQDPPEEIPI